MNIPQGELTDIARRMQRSLHESDNYLAACAKVAATMLHEQAERLTRPTLTFDYLMEINRQRCRRWHSEGKEWTGADWSNAMGGECGEAQNVVKKLRRDETGTGSANNPPHPDLLEALGNELADTLLYMCLLADHYSIDLPAAIVRKFNLVSEREDLPERLELQHGQA